MNDKRLDYIALIAQYGSILRASEKLYITASALSKFVQNLEQSLGIKLFDRVGKRFVLTYAGERYLEWMTKISNLNEEMLSEMQDLSNSNTGCIRIGIQLSGVDFLVGIVLPQFYHKYPNIKIELFEDTSTNLRKMLEDNYLDFALIPKETESPNLVLISLAENHQVIVVPTSSHLIEEASVRNGFPYPWIDLNCCRNERFIAPFSTQDAYRPYEQIYADYGYKPNIVCQTKDVGTILIAVSNGIGIALSQDLIVKSNKNTADLHLLSFGKKPLMNSFVLAYHKYHHLDLPSCALIEQYRQKFTAI